MTSEDEPGDGAAEIVVETPTERERAGLRRARRVSTLLDDAVRIPVVGWRIGFDPVISLLPIGGDAVAAALSAYVLVEAYLLGAPKGILARMVANVALDFLGGSIPVLGTLFDAYWKANERNVALLERYVGVR